MKVTQRIQRCFSVFRNSFRRYCTTKEQEAATLHNNVFKNAYLLPEKGHNVLLIQPGTKFTTRSTVSDKSRIAIQPSIEEATALIDSLDWNVVALLSFTMRERPNSIRQPFFTKGIWDDVSRIVSDYRQGQKPSEQQIISTSVKIQHLGIAGSGVSAVFINWPRLSTIQLAHIQKCWQLPVYDRYSIVVQLFVLKAQSREAKLHAQLAELDLLRARLPAFLASGRSNVHINLSSAQFDNLAISNPYDAIKMKKDKLSKDLHLLQHRKQNTGNQRSRTGEHNTPTVTVVGYTNAGKTSLISCLSKKLNLFVSPQVFATLDITRHRARLPTPVDADSDVGSSGIGTPGVQISLMDTIGFMSDLPTSLIPAFQATLNDSLQTDLIIHLVDISVPDWENKMSHVDATLSNADRLLSNIDKWNKHMTKKDVDAPLPKILRVGNKADRGLAYVNDTNRSKLNLLISSKEQTGISALTELIQNELMEALGWFCRTVSLKQGSDALRWLYSNAMVTKVKASEKDPEQLHVSAVFSPITWNKLLKYFSHSPE